LLNHFSTQIRSAKTLFGNLKKDKEFNMQVEREELHRKGLTIKQLAVGQSYEKSFAITAELIEQFAEVTGDHNPIHLNEDYAAKSIFKQRVAQGMLQAGLLSGILGCHFPGVGTIYLSQTLKFIKPVFIKDQITLRLEVWKSSARKTAFVSKHDSPIRTVKPSSLVRRLLSPRPNDYPEPISKMSFGPIDFVALLISL
jgi:3-hydroxybutyryl-CoA dehydratase